jgi:hypothetical protein
VAAMKKLFTLVLVFLLAFSLAPLILVVHAPEAETHVGDTTTNYATSYNFQRKGFYAEGLYWVFYCNGSDLVYKTSSDGSTWSSLTLIRENVTGGFQFSIAYNGTVMGYALADGVNWHSIYYRAGTPQSDGSINWLAAEQNVGAGILNYYYEYPVLAYENGGYPWISYSNGTGAGGVRSLFVLRSWTTDGTWGTGSGFPYNLTTYNTTGTSSIIPLQSNRMYVVGSSIDDANLTGFLWNGAAFSSAESILADGTIFASVSYALAAASDDVWVIYATGTNTSIIKRTYASSTWGSATQLYSGASQDPTITKDGINLYCGWIVGVNATHFTIYSRNYISSSWQTTTSTTIAGDLWDYSGTGPYESDAVPWIVWTSSGYASFSLIDGAAPTFSAITSNSTVSGAATQLSCNVSDDTAVSGYIFSHDNGNGTWVNATWTSGASATTSFNWTNTVGNTGHGKVYANDTSNNWGTSTQYNFTLTADTYTVTLTPSSTTATLGDSIIITIGISRTTDTAVTNYKLNITKDGTLYKENFAESQFAETEINPTGHIYNVTGLVDEDASASVTPTCAGTSLTWKAEGTTTPSQAPTQPTFQIDAVDLGAVTPNSTATATLHFTYANSSFTLFSLSMDAPFQQWYSGGNFNTETIYTGQSEGNVLLTFTVPGDVALQSYSGAVTVQAIDQTGTVHTSTADIAAEAIPEGAGLAYWIRTHLAYVILAIGGVLFGLICIAVFVKRRR